MFLKIPRLSLSRLPNLSGSISLDSTFNHTREGWGTSQRSIGTAWTGRVVLYFLFLQGVAGFFTHY